MEPSRTGTNRRLYSDQDVERLELLKLATQAGYSISNVAGLSTEHLSRIAAEEDLRSEADPEPKPAAPAQWIEECIEAIRDMDGAKLDATLEHGLLSLGQHGLLERVIGPLAQRVGDLWRDGTLTAAHEHFATASIREFLGQNSKSFVPGGNAPVLIVSTPVGQLHELGAVIAAAAASDMGWRVIYLGPSLPAAEIAAAAIQNKARAVALSIVYPEDDETLGAELERLANYLPEGTELIVGGRASASYGAALEKATADRIAELKGFYTKLEALRKTAE